MMANSWRFKSLYQVAIVFRYGDEIQERPIFIQAEDDAAVTSYMNQHHPEAIRWYIQQEVSK